MARYRSLNGSRVAFTAAEEAQADKDDAAAIVRKQAKADAKVAKEAADAQTAIDKGTGNQKLLDLGLTQAEVDALTGQ